MEDYLLEEFKGDQFDSRFQWMNPPEKFELNNQQLVVQCKPKTDFWNTTFYGFIRHDGHFLHIDLPRSEDFVISTTVHSNPIQQYDQAGLMVRYSNTCWLKTSIEYEPGEHNMLGAVVTNQGFSDWSTQNAEKGKNAICFRIRKLGPDFIVEYSFEIEKSDVEKKWNPIRMARLLDNTTPETFSVGLYCCSPTGGDYRASFDYLKIQKGRIPSAH
eukprot:TRINITY_DN4220_c0_g1_i1.p1 TRINITY_DN4220_c0_g1~~TRINITY_DN4220_c0_g1_i1.p1  ORF type:complete len:215 (+),score=54.32 TRINITY_DN4220_c0_g1_i1:131-775(+)